MIERIIVLIIGYFIGDLIQGGFLIGKFNKIDIRNYGSGNAGTTNVMRTLGKKAGFLTYFLDTFKAILSCIIVHFLFGKNCDYELLLFLYSGLGVILGHNFLFYLKFKGGKGIAATSGVALLDNSCCCHGDIFYCNVHNQIRIIRLSLRYRHDTCIIYNLGISGLASTFRFTSV